jgi:hypothetical protein
LKKIKVGQGSETTVWIKKTRASTKYVQAMKSKREKAML